ncbi:MAG: methyltransferase domain-containing protein [Betaproteobacteria bacterium]
MKVGNNIEAGNASWNFGGDVPDNFVSHIRQSVPLYEEGHELVRQLSDFFVSNRSVVYEIGVSTGELLKKLATHNRAKGESRWIGIDVEPAMVAKARAHCSDCANVSIEQEDARAFTFEKTDLVVAYYTMQFIPPRDRQALFDRIYQALNWGGAFIVFEKVRAPDARFQDIMVTLYNEFKLANGFSPEEILTKTRSLKGILEPFSTEGNLGLLRRAGFVDITTILKYVSFEGFLAIK